MRFRQQPHVRGGLLARRKGAKLSSRPVIVALPPSRTGSVSLDLALFSQKFRRLLELFQEDAARVASVTRIPEDRLRGFEAGSTMPTGDEILVLADHFKEDFRFFISNEQKTVLDRTEKLFRAHSKDLSTADRWAIQEFLFLCDNEAYLQSELGRKPRLTFSPVVKGTYRIGHGLDAARSLRSRLGYNERTVPRDIFADLRSLGLHVFRRRLENDNLSGLFIEHPVAGSCVLVNYSEDMYRQRFTAAHEAAHAFFDRGDEFVVSYSKWSKDDLVEIRADAFASAFLIPPELLSAVDLQTLDERRLLELADQLKVSVRALLRAFVRDKLIDRDVTERFRNVRLPRGAKVDPELPDSLTDRERARKLRSLQLGLSSAYLDLCLEALQRGIITRARLAEVLLVGEPDLDDVVHLYGMTGK